LEDDAQKHRNIGYDHKFRDKENNNNKNEFSNNNDDTEKAIAIKEHHAIPNGFKNISKIVIKKENVDMALIDAGKEQ